jgi:DNA replication and repair protein RecF
MRDRNRLLRDEVTRRRWYAALEAQMARAGAALAANRRAALTRLAARRPMRPPPFPVADLALTTPRRCPRTSRA